MGMRCRICVEVLENGYTVELPDIAAMNKAEADAKKSKGNMSMPYSGDFMKEYMAKTVNEVIALIKPQVAGRADMGEISKLVKAKLAGA